MAFNVVFHTFSKKERSTAVPSGAGRTVSCTANEPMDLLAPMISLDWSGVTGDPVAYNYCYIAAFSRYYWITGWKFDGGLWWASLRVDPLASWKSSIGGQSLYVYRSAYSYNGKIVDTLYPTIARFRRFKVSIPRMWSVDAATALVSQGEGRFVIGIVGDGQTRYYAMTSAQLDAFMAAIFAPSFYSAILGEFGATEYPEAKVAINPLQYISSIRFYPCGWGVPGTAWALHITSSVTTIPVGPVSVTASASCFVAAGSWPDQTSFNGTSYDVDIDTTDFLHPQAQDRGDYLQLAPFTEYEAFVPPWGLLPINPADMVGATDLRVSIAVDVRSGSGVLTLEAVYSATSSQVVARSIAQVGIECPLSAVVQPGTTPMSTATKLLGAVASAFVGNVGGMIGGIEAAVGDAVKNEIPHLSVVGSQGSGAAMAGSPFLQVIHRYVADDDLQDKGRPLMDVRQLSAIPGYIMADSDAVSISCTEEELGQIREAIRSGFFYE